jgi:hypothetical protein
MTHLSRVIFLTVILGFFAIVFSFVPRHPVVAAPPTPAVPVDVTNTPLPVTGNVNATISGTPAVTISGMPTLAIASGAAVSVNNAATNPVLVSDVDNPAHNPVMVLCGVSENTGNCNLFTETIPGSSTIPAGFELVIDSVSGTFFVPTGAVPNLVEVAAQIGGTPYVVYFNPVPQGTAASFTYYTVSQATRMFCDGSTSVSMGVNSQNATGPATGQFTLTGHLVKCGAGTGCPAL